MQFYWWILLNQYELKGMVFLISKPPKAANVKWKKKYASKSVSYVFRNHDLISIWVGLLAAVVATAIRGQENWKFKGII